MVGASPSRAKHLASLLAGLLACALVLAEATAALAAFPGGNGRIVFRSSRSGSPYLYAVNAKGKNLVRVTTGSDTSPATSPDGRSIAFVRAIGGSAAKQRVFVANADGTDVRRLTGIAQTELDPAWSPDGTSIVYVSRTAPDAPFTLFVVDVSSGAREQLTDPVTGVADRAPAWSPQGDRIAFASNRGGGLPEIWLVDVGSGALTRLTENAEADANPSWSPDGRKLAVDRCCALKSSEIYVIKVADGSERNVTKSRRQDTDPAWSPDGRRIAYVSSGTDGNLDVWIVTLDGSLPLFRLTSNVGPDVSPDWAVGAGGATGGTA